MCLAYAGLVALIFLFYQLLSLEQINLTLAICMDYQSWKDGELKHELSIALMCTKVRSSMVNDLVHWAITCNVVGTHILKSQDRIGIHNLILRYQISTWDKWELVIYNVGFGYFVKGLLKFIFHKYKNGQEIKLGT